jgi:hypothetical protein
MQVLLSRKPSREYTCSVLFYITAFVDQDRPAGLRTGWITVTVAPGLVERTIPRCKAYRILRLVQRYGELVWLARRSYTVNDQEYVIGARLTFEVMYRIPAWLRDLLAVWLDWVTEQRLGEKPLSRYDCEAVRRNAKAVEQLAEQLSQGYLPSMERDLPRMLYKLAQEVA